MKQTETLGFRNNFWQPEGADTYSELTCGIWDRGWWEFGAVGQMTGISFGHLRITMNCWSAGCTNIMFLNTYSFQRRNLHVHQSCICTHTHTHTEWEREKGVHWRPKQFHSGWVLKLKNCIISNVKTEIRRTDPNASKTRPAHRWVGPNLHNGGSHCAEVHWQPDSGLPCLPVRRRSRLNVSLSVEFASKSRVAVLYETRNGTTWSIIHETERQWWIKLTSFVCIVSGPSFRLNFCFPYMCQTKLLLHCVPARPDWSTKPRKWQLNIWRQAEIGSRLLNWLPQKTRASESVSWRCN